MTGFLGYDPGLVDALRLAMRRAVDDLAAIRCTDPEAVPAIGTLTAARSLLTGTWQPFVDSLFQCRAMDAYRPAQIEASDLINGWMRSVAGQRQWTVVTDPLPTVAEPMTADEARLLGESLSGPAGEETMTGDEITWLAARLTEIAAKPTLMAAFLPAFTTVGWANVCNQLGDARQQRVTNALIDDSSISDPERAGWAAIDAVFTSFGTILVANRKANPLSDATILLTDMTPYAAALLVRDLALDADALSVVARRLIERERIDLVSVDQTILGPRAADLLFATILTTPHGATSYLMQTLDDPALVLDVAFEPGLGNAIAIAGTEPASMTASQAAEAIPILAMWMVNAQTFTLYVLYNQLLAVTAADVIAPYLLPIIRTTSAGYGLTARERRAISELVLDDHGDAFGHLLAARDRMVSGLESSISSADTLATRLSMLADIADLLAIVDTMARARSIESASRAQAEWNVMWTAVGYVASVASLGGGGWTNVTGPAVTALHHVADVFGWGPASVSSVRTASLDRFDQVTSAAAAGLVAATFDRMVSDGRIQPGASLPPVPEMGAENTGEAYGEAFREWLATSDFAPDVASELNSIKQTISSDHESMTDADGALLGL